MNTSPNQTPEGGDRISHEPGKSQDTLAKIELFVTTPQGDKTSISASIGTPYMTLDGFWRAPMNFTGLGDPSPEIYGVDSFQALFKAVHRVRQEIIKLAGSGNELADKDGSRFSPEEYF